MFCTIFVHGTIGGVGVNFLVKAKRNGLGAGTFQGKWGLLRYIVRVRVIALAIKGTFLGRVPSITSNVSYRIIKFYQGETFGGYLWHARVVIT